MGAEMGDWEAGACAVLRDFGLSPRRTVAGAPHVPRYIVPLAQGILPRIFGVPMGVFPFTLPIALRRTSLAWGWVGGAWGQ